MYSGGLWYQKNCVFLGGMIFKQKYFQYFHEFKAFVIICAIKYFVKSNEFII